MQSIITINLWMLESDTMQQILFLFFYFSGVLGVLTWPFFCVFQAMLSEWGFGFSVFYWKFWGCFMDDYMIMNAINYHNQSMDVRE